MSLAETPCLVGFWQCDARENRRQPFGLVS